MYVCYFESTENTVLDFCVLLFKLVYGIQKFREWLLAALLSWSRSLVVSTICLTFDAHHDTSHLPKNRFKETVV